MVIDQTIHLHPPTRLEVMKIQAFAAALAVALTASLAQAREVAVVNQSISESDVIAAQKAWCAALISINATYDKDG